MINNTILEYISTERARGVHDEDIRSALLASGWKDEDVDSAFMGVREAQGVSVSSLTRTTPTFSISYIGSLGDGRIGRWDYFFGGLLLLIFMIVLTMFEAFAGGFVSSFLSLSKTLEIVLFGLIILFSVIVPLSYLSFCLSIRRLHDLGHSGWWVVLSFVPYLSIGLTVVLLFFRGHAHANAYGPVEGYSHSLEGAWNSIFRRD